MNSKIVSLSACVLLGVIVAVFAAPNGNANNTKIGAPAPGSGSHPIVIGVTSTKQAQKPVATGRAGLNNSSRPVPSRPVRSALNLTKSQKHDESEEEVDSSESTKAKNPSFGGHAFSLGTKDAISGASNSANQNGAPLIPANANGQNSGLNLGNGAPVRGGVAQPHTTLGVHITNQTRVGSVGATSTIVI